MLFLPFGLIQQAGAVRRRAVQAINDFNAALTSEHGERFGVFAPVPLRGLSALRCRTVMQWAAGRIVPSPCGAPAAPRRR